MLVYFSIIQCLTSSFYFSTPSIILPRSLGEDNNENRCRELLREEFMLYSYKDQLSTGVGMPIR